jgi:hypothetical protein
MKQKTASSEVIPGLIEISGGKGLLYTFLPDSMRPLRQG